MAHIEALTKFIQQALNDSQHNLSLLNAEMTLMRVFRNRMALDIITTSQGGTSAIIQTECYMIIPNTSANVLSLLSHRMTK